MRTWLLMLLVVAAACGRRTAMPAIDARVPLPLTNDVDLLFVIDDAGGSVGDVQASFDVAISRIVAELDALPNGRPNLHIGVVSTSVGIGSASFGENCASGDDGLLQNAARGTGCTAPSDRYVIDVASTSGGRITNYPTTEPLADALACIAQLGAGGCGFIAPLESMKRALDGSRPENAGFLRDGAALVVVVLADGDDCSADPSFFDQPFLANAGTLRCVVFGETCDQPFSPTIAGTYTGCVPKTGGYLHDTANYVDFLTTLKDPARVAVLVIAGNPETTFVVEGLYLEPSCTATINGNFYGSQPANRLADFIRRANAAGIAAADLTVCAGDYSQYAPPLANLVNAAMQ